ncbi:MAG: hypothetical protein J0M26_13145 [Planctomycetes bacterium]|nr:hypothetical protein [Planctomycetota bacterium]
MSCENDLRPLSVPGSPSEFPAAQSPAAQFPATSLAHFEERFNSGEHSLKIVFDSSISPTVGIESQVERVVVRDSQRLTVLCDVDDWTMQKLLGALTDEPVDFNGLLRAVQVFEPIPALHVESGALSSESELFAAYHSNCDVSSWVWIDLEARMVVQWLPVFHAGLYQCDDALTGQSEVVYTLLPPEWRFESVSSCPNWFDILSARQKSKGLAAQVDVRSILWGAALTRDWVEMVWEFRKRIGEEIWRSHAESKSGWIQEQLIRIFLKTTRADLGDLAPWTVLQDSRAFVDQACQYRRELWVHLGKPPLCKADDKPIAQTTRMGTVQTRLLLEMYDYLLTKIQGSAWTTPGASLESWRDCVEKWKAHFLSSTPEHSVWSRHELIELEQALMPIPMKRVEWRRTQSSTAFSDERKTISPQGPAAPFTAESQPECTLDVSSDSSSGGPRVCASELLPHFEEIYSFDGTWDYEQPGVEPQGSGVIDATSQRTVEPSLERIASSNLGDISCLAETEKSELDRGEDEAEEFTTVWKNSYLNWDADWPVEACYSFLVMKLSFLVSEILMELQRADDRWYGEELTERFKHLQQAGEDEDAAAFSLSAEVFCDLLEDMTQAHPGLVPRLADLQSRLWEQIRKLGSKRLR